MSVSTTPLDGRSSVCALVPHFQCEQWLGQAIESLLDQTRPPDAIVVIDDGSQEPPIDVVRAFPEVTLLAADDNGGPYRLVQAVIDRTEFDGYLFQDADDWSAPDRLEVLLAAAESTGADLVGSHEIRVLVTEGDIVPVTYPLDVNAVLCERPTAFPLLHPTSIVTRSLVGRLGGFSSGMRFSGDAEFLRRAAHVARVVNADHFGYFRRKRPGSLTLGSTTALGSPARQGVQSVLAARARHNAARVAAGKAPDLRPWLTTAPPYLRHLAGPDLDRVGRPERSLARVVQRGPRPASVGAPRASGGRSSRPVFVVGAPRSGHAMVALALGQHRQLELVHDGRWLARAAGDIERRAAEPAAPAPTGFRDHLAAALLAVTTGPLGRRPVVAGTELLPAAHALATLFPDAGFVHVVRDPADLVRALAGSPTTDGAFHTPDSAWRSWVAAVEAGLALERALGADRVLRVGYDELCRDGAAVADRCLAFVGLDPDPSCNRPLREVQPADDVGLAAPPAPVAARIDELCRALAGSAPPAVPRPDDTAALAERFRRDWRGTGPGESLVERMRALVVAAVPEGSTVAVVSRGDPRLVDLGGRRGWHVPQVDDGVYAGHHPADSDEALAQVVDLHGRGAEYFAVPASGLWWLTFYDGLRRHLETSATLVAFQDEVGAVFRLGVVAPAPDDGTPAPPRFVPVAALSEVR